MVPWWWYSLMLWPLHPWLPPLDPCSQAWYAPCLPWPPLGGSPKADKTWEPVHNTPDKKVLNKPPVINLQLYLQGAPRSLPKIPGFHRSQSWRQNLLLAACVTFAVRYLLLWLPGSEVFGAIRAHWVGGSVSSQWGSGLALQQGWPHLCPRLEEEPGPIWKAESWGFFGETFLSFFMTFWNKKLWGFFFPVPFCFEWLAIFVGTCLKEKDTLIGKGSVSIISSCAITSNMLFIL